MSYDQRSNTSDMSIVMGYEAMRICLGQPTKHYYPEEVLEWMRLVLKESTKPQTPVCMGTEPKQSTP